MIMKTNWWEISYKVKIVPVWYRLIRVRADRNDENYYFYQPYVKIMLSTPLQLNQSKNSFWADKLKDKKQKGPDGIDYE